MFRSPKFSFIQFSDTISCGEMPLPVKETTDIVTSIYQTTLPYSGVKSVKIKFVSQDGTQELDSKTVSVTFTQLTSLSVAQISPLQVGFQYLAPMDCFRICLEIGTEKLYSNLLKYVPVLDYYSVVEVKNSSNAFDFIKNYSEKIRVPLILGKEKFPQDEEIYTFRDGGRKQLFASVGDECEVEVGFLTKKMHKNLIMMFSCDDLNIDGEGFFKSGDYAIDYQTEIVENGHTLYKASSKVSGNNNYKNCNQ